ncbi:uncharacterized protein FTOL_13973 [Fusarium torulosum]|uniref:Uncharacterized protein n=1 Tax=Fusarium torulosum TaxID=33205 RepID=A0AAE8MMX8_9HYPO|nr:uncharacterized protein FTOL_13973 [Fusarium torulosum]
MGYRVGQYSTATINAAMARRKNSTSPIPP